MKMTFALALVACAALAQEWTLSPADDPAKLMVQGIVRYLEKLPAKPVEQDLAKLLGVVDRRVPFTDLELVATLRQPALRASTDGFDAYAVRWPVLPGVTAEGLLLQPKQQPVRERIIGIPEVGMPPERFVAMQAQASKGAQVLIPVLIDRASKWSGNPAIGKTTNQSHREFLYRMSFPLGRHPVGYEVQKALAAVDWFSQQEPKVPIRAVGIGEGASIAAYAKAIDSRIASAAGGGFAWNRDDVAAEPIDRNIWKIRLAKVEPAGPFQFTGGNSAIPPAPDAEARMKRQFDELVQFNQKQIGESERVRAELWKNTGKEEIRRRLWEDVFGRIPKSPAPLHVRRKQSYDAPKWTGYEVQFDVLPPDVFGYGVLLMPKNMRPGEKRPVVVAQHGLNGRPQLLFQQPKESKDWDVYRNLAEMLIDQGYIVYAPQNPYIGEFRHIVRHANPLGLSLFSFILAQYEKMLDMLTAMPEVDTKRIGFYGLSYGGATAMRVPALLTQFQAVVCSGNFNEWIHKLATVEMPYSYVFTHEYEIVEFGLANVANHAEMAMLIAPRRFLVERGHRDGVGVDEWVFREYAKVRRYYDENGWKDRTGLVLFNGPHRIAGAEAIPLLRSWLGGELE